MRASPIKKIKIQIVSVFVAGGQGGKCLEEQWPYAGKATAHEINVLMSTRACARGKQGKRLQWAENAERERGREAVWE